MKKRRKKAMNFLLKQREMYEFHSSKLSHETRINVQPIQGHD